jgi:hypothetical protein
MTWLLVVYFVMVGSCSLVGCVLAQRLLGEPSRKGTKRWLDALSFLDTSEITIKPAPASAGAGFCWGKLAE